MIQIKPLRLTLFTLIFAFAGILLFTISPVANKLHAASLGTSLVSGSSNVKTPASSKTKDKTSKPSKNTVKTNKKHAQAIFAMGCFWCAESDFEKVPGVINVVSGYTGGSAKNPTYEQVSYTETGHYEAILVTYDPQKIRYGQLLKTFWANIDPFDANGQFCDKGTSYRAAIFPSTEIEMRAANASKDYVAKAFKKELATKVIPKTTFYPAEHYHQDYYKKNPVRYDLYRNGCGRDNRLEAIWGKKKK